MVSGLTLHRIAAELEVKYGTVSSMVDRIKKKRGAATKLELVTSELRERAIRLAITCDLPSGTKK
jgi:DNA-binding NarL/FixJ family response regulator